MRTRSEYRLSPIPVQRPSAVLDSQPLDDDMRDELARLMLDAYRGTIDDEGENLADALVAIDHYLAHAAREYSIVVRDSDTLAGIAFVSMVADIPYVDPIVVTPRLKRTGVGRAAVQALLTSLRNDGVEVVGATITDGNVASEGLFTGLGFERCGAWR